MQLKLHFRKSIVFITVFLWSVIARDTELDYFFQDSQNSIEVSIKDKAINLGSSLLESSAIKSVPSEKPRAENLNTINVVKKNKSRHLSKLKSKNFTADCVKQIDLIKGDHNLKSRLGAEIDQYIGDWFLDSKAELVNDRRPASVEEAFMLALYHSSLLEGLKPKTINYDESLSLLSQVALDAPLNSAPWVYLYYISKRAGKFEKLEEYVTKISQSSYFNSYSMFVDGLLFSRVVNAYDLIDAYALSSGVPVPNLIAVRSVAMEIKSLKLADQLMASSLEEKYSVSSSKWSAYEYAISYLLFRDLGSSSQFPHPKELITRKINENKIYQAFYSFFNLTCDIDELGGVAAEVSKSAALAH